MEDSLRAWRYQLQSRPSLRISPMPSWADFEAAAPEFASRVRGLLSSRKHLTMATVRRDGSPRISGTEVKFVDGQLEIGSMPNAVKALDLRRDPRVAIHGPTEDPPASNAAPGKARLRFPAQRRRSTPAPPPIAS